MQFPYSNIARIEKKVNAMVFDNSMSIYTKEDKEVFFTSFVFRDQAYEIIKKQMNDFDSERKASLVPDINVKNLVDNI